MSSAGQLDPKGLSKSPPMSPKSAQFHLLPPPKPATDTTSSLAATPEIEENKSKKQDKKPLILQPLPLSNTVSPASLYSVLPASGLNGQLNTGPSVINKQLLSKLNKSLKEKQKVTSTKESHARNSALIQEVMSPALQQSFNVSGSASSETTGTHNNVPLNESMDLDWAADSDVSNLTGQGKDDVSVKAKSKLVAKQNSTRTDFFAAKLAIAVDDVESSDSDETFIYETNANEYNADDRNGVPTGLSQDEQRKQQQISIADNASQANPDVMSLSGSVRGASNLGSHATSPTAEIRKDEDSSSFVMPPPHHSVTKAESIHSLQSMKYNLRNTFNTTPPVNANSRSQSVNHTPANHNENPVFSNPYFDNLQKDNLNFGGKNSNQSLASTEDKNQGMRYSILHYADSTLMPYGVNETLTNSNSINEPYVDGNFSSDDDEDASNDETSSHGDTNLMCTDAHGSSALRPNGQRPIDTASVSSKAKKNKSSTTSSKLRSTTSKLFDKKGAQPRRYSTIPDDIDIEDFDDELIYYDNNNIRFPYGSHQDNTNESSSLVGGGKIPHYRSLNLNFGARKPSKQIKGQRFLSLGYVPSSHVNGNKRNDIFPFPYMEHEQPYLDFDEYNEDAKMGMNDQIRAKRISSNRTHFLGDGYIIPRYSNEDLKSNRKGSTAKNVIYTLLGISLILSLGFVLGFFLASTKELANVSIVSIENPLVSQDELVFSIVIEALNPGWFAVSINDLELDIFAKSGYLGEQNIESGLETVLLGSVLNLESAVTFEGMFFHRKRSRHTGEIKLVSPGRNITGSRVTESPDAQKIISQTHGSEPTSLPDNSEKWSIISKHPFDLILRGVLKYNLPITSATKTVVVNKVGYVDPSVPS
ncbi:hypothetical protein PUMCH_004374 [Australozyma saopauloensis]|uniref:Vacuolar segregation protein 7 n=1 Tax=Australozyma saopauloensis TaxID=291208 RepID=A0AAX4HEV0_9ASCO|nr:hypothetical protein PUMCH_004374 [[Candida] saopauloensis]